MSPDGSRLVTAAGGELTGHRYGHEDLSLTILWMILDGHVRIWSTEAIYNAANPEYADKPRQLASMSNHSGTIHTVRFSPNGRYLASGADDKIVCIYQLEATPPSHAATFGMCGYPCDLTAADVRNLV